MHGAGRNIGSSPDKLQSSEFPVYNALAYLEIALSLLIRRGGEGADGRSAGQPFVMHALDPFSTLGMFTSCILCVIAAAGTFCTTIIGQVIEMKRRSRDASRRTPVRRIGFDSHICRQCRTLYVDPARQSLLRMKRSSLQLLVWCTAKTF